MKDLVVHAHKLKVTISGDHRVELRLPDDFPEGPAEVIVLAGRSSRDDSPAPSQKRALAALAALRAVPLTPEEEEVLDQFEAFQREHPIRFSSLIDED